MAQAESNLSPIRDRAHAAQMLSHLETVAAKPRRFVVYCDAIKGDGYIAEVDLDHTDATAITKDILSGQYSKPVRVFELTDRTEEFAGRVAEQALEEAISDGATLDRDAAYFLNRNDVETDEIDAFSNQWAEDNGQFGVGA